jgi:hypothetical protein
VTFFLVASILSLAWNVLDYRPILYKEGYVVLDVPLQKLMRDVSNLCLGVNGNVKIARDVAEVVGKEMKDLGVDAIIFGTLDTLSKDDEDLLKRFSTSPYLTVEIIKLMAEGFSNAGILPIIDGRGKVDPKVVKTLISMKTTYPVFVESSEKADFLLSLGYNAFFFTPSGPLNGKEISFKWKSERKLDSEKIRRAALEKSIVILNPFGEGISINDPRSNAKVLIFSPDDWLYDLAKKVEKGEVPPTGRRVW